MRIAILGINHKSAHLSLREAFAKACHKRFGLLSFHQKEVFYVLLSTCNRTEIYYHSEDVAKDHTYLLNVLRQEIDEEFEHSVYSYFGSDCFLHLAKVTSGMDSAILGETEIQGQVKLAYENYCKHFCLPSELHFLFQKCLKIGKTMRCQSSFNVPTFEEIVFELGMNFFSQQLAVQKILIVGVSEINQKICKYFQKRGAKYLTICNRTQQKGRAFAEKQQIEHLDWSKKERWSNYDCLIVGTKSLYYLINQEDWLVKERKLLFDLSVPRNIDPLISKQWYSTVINMDQVNFAVAKRSRVHLEMAILKSKEIANAVDRQLSIYHQKTVLKHYDYELVSS